MNNKTNHSIVRMLAVAALSTFALIAGVPRSGGMTTDPQIAGDHKIVDELKHDLKLKDLALADPRDNPRASGIIKMEDEKKGVLVLLTKDVCNAKGASGQVFVKPYVKQKLEEPADCDGKKIDRYRVEQQERSVVGG